MKLKSEMRKPEAREKPGPPSKTLSRPREHQGIAGSPEICPQPSETSINAARQIIQQHEPSRYLRCVLELMILLLLATARATPPLELDPVCQSPNLQAVVNARRTELAAVDSPSSRVRLAGVGIKPSLTAGWDASTLRPWLTLRGQRGSAYQLLSATAITGPWQPALGLVLDEAEWRWTDSSTEDASARFYQLTEATPQNREVLTSNFRLIDLDGNSHELYYHTHRQALVVVAAGERLENLTPLVADLNALQATVPFGGVEVWALLADDSRPRGELLDAADKMGLSFPVLVDGDHLVARVLGLSHVNEAALVRTPDFVTVYRGAVKEEQRTFLKDAVVALNKGGLPTVWQTQVGTPQLPKMSAGIPSYARDIAPLLRTHCVRCHRPRDVAPFALTSYSDLQARASSIHHQVMSGNMPPWDANPEYGQFADSLALPSNDKRMLIAWIEAGSPRGEGPDPLEQPLDTTPFFSLPAALGEPDAILTLPVQTIKATGTEPYRTLEVRSPNTSNVWLRAAAVIPGNREVVHHFIVYQPLPSELVGEINLGFSMYVPGREPIIFPEGTGMYLGRSTSLLFELHYTPNGRPATDEPKLYLWYHRDRPLKSFRTFTVVDSTFQIPPGERAHRVSAAHRFEQSVTLHALANHMHVRGRSMTIEAVYPTGTREVLLAVPRYRFNWQLRYELAHPKTLPPGTTIEVRGTFDNSAQNLANPDPSASVVWGQQTWDEMFMGVLEIAE
jgi:mono/diheme cytochrome c family protein